ncbi:MAG: ZIP family metal transporter [Armatimonadetes bacterium]|nr:ZIP family metal transporter [Armatimonadota bacterium]
MPLKTLILFLAFLAGLMDILGGYLTLIKKQLSRQTLRYFIAIAAGFILSAAILDRIPEAMVNNPNGALFILIGFLIIYLIENLFAIHAHENSSQEHTHALVCEPQEECFIEKQASLTAFIGLLVHTFFDGVAIASGFITSLHTGILMFLAVFFHKLPEGFSMSSLVLAANQGRKFALFSAIALGVSTFLGAIFAYYLGFSNNNLTRILLTLATGTFLYIGASDLIPATNACRDRHSILFVMLGVVLFYISLYILQIIGIKI